MVCIAEVNCFRRFALHLKVNW